MSASSNFRFRSSTSRCNGTEDNKSEEARFSFIAALGGVFPSSVIRLRKEKLTHRFEVNAKERSLLVDSSF